MKVEQWNSDPQDFGKVLTQRLAREGFLLFRGDAYDLLSALPQASVDLLLTSPPYWGQRTYGCEHNWEIGAEWRPHASSLTALPSYDWYRKHGGVLGLEPFPEWYVAHLVEIIEKGKRAIKPSGSLWVNLGDTYFARWSSIRENGRQGLGDEARSRRRTPMGGYRQEKQLLLVPSRFAIAMQEKRWILRNDLIWHKPNVPPRPEKDRLRLAHEHFFHFVHRPTQGRARYYYDQGAVETEQNDVVTCLVRPGEEGHTATFPVKLIAPRIASSCPPEGVVLDPFAGSGRSLVAARRLGRKAIGFDVVGEFVETARRVLAQEALALA